MNADEPDWLETTAARSPVEQPQDRLWLLLVRGAELVRCPLPASGRVLVGRSSVCDIVVRDASVSRVHATIEVGEKLTLTRNEQASGALVVRSSSLDPGERATVRVGEPFELGALAAVIQRGPAHDHPLPAPSRSVAPHDAVCVDPAMQRLFSLVDRVGPSNIAVLIRGETGVGKEVVARSIHRASPRAARELVTVNCAALAPALLESELFGHEKGAFTGAQQARPGLFEAASGGTLFLDEIGELSLDAQSRLLRVLELGEVRRVGSNRARIVDVRIIAATHRDLHAMCLDQRFRSDLYYRINGLTLDVPPLRARTAEIDALIDAFARSTDARGAAAFSSEARAALRGWSWPGNVRELRNVVQRALLLAGAELVRVEHLPMELTSGARAESEGAPLSAALKEIERRRILEALERCEGNQTRAATLLQMPRRTLVHRLTELGLTRPRSAR